MIDRLIKLVIAVVVVALIALFLRWAMGALGVPPMAETIVWIVFGLILLVGLLGLLGYGPFKGSLVVVLVFAACASAAPPKAPGPKIVAVGEVFEVEFVVDPKGPAVLSNPHPLEDVFVREAVPTKQGTVAYIIQPKKAGTFRFTLWTKGDTVGDVIPVTYYDFQAGGAPPPVVPPVPTTNYRVMFVYESADTITAAEKGLVYGKVVEDWLKTNTQGYRRRDKNAPGETDVAFKTMWAQAQPEFLPPKNTKTPAAVIWTDSKFEIIPLYHLDGPKKGVVFTPDEFVEVLKGYK